MDSPFASLITLSQLTLANHVEEAKVLYDRVGRDLDNLDAHGDFSSLSGLSR